MALTGKRLLNINHLSRARLHESTSPLPRPLEACPTAHHSAVLEIAFIPGHNLYRRRLDVLASLDTPKFGVIVFFQPGFLFNVDHVHEVVQRVERRGVGDVVDEEEGIGLQVGCRPETAVFFLARRVGQGQEVGEAINGASDGIRVFNRRVVSAIGRASVSSRPGPTQNREGGRPGHRSRFLTVVADRYGQHHSLMGPLGADQAQGNG